MINKNDLKIVFYFIQVQLYFLVKLRHDGNFVEYFLFLVLFTMTVDIAALLEKNWRYKISS